MFIGMYGGFPHYGVPHTFYSFIAFQWLLKHHSPFDEFSKGILDVLEML